MIRTLACLVALSAVTPAQAYSTNTVWWDEDQLPVRIELVRPGSEDLGEQGTEDAVLAALDEWAEVGCTTLSYEFLGWVDETVMFDEIVQIEWIEEGWPSAEQVAGATAISVDPEAGRIRDVNIQFNGEFLVWTTDGSNPYASPMELDVGAVAVHEFGHLFGMDHNYDMVEATMFWGYTSAAGGVLSWDDKWGICWLYPGGVDECQVDEDCPDSPYQDYRCREIEDLGLRVCEEIYEGLGGCCSAHWNNCQDVLCRVHEPDYEGYCTDFCEEDTDCPPGWSCESVTYIGEPMGWCVSPLGEEQPCGEDFEYPGDDDDSAGTIDHGVEVIPVVPLEQGGCQCSAAGEPRGAGWPLALGLAVAGWRRRRGR